MTEPDPVALNDLADVVRLLQSNRFGRLLMNADAADCNCMGSYTCTGRSTLDDVEALPMADQITLKKARVRELQRQIDDAERRLPEPGPAERDQPPSA
jgi:hypothetical protein